MDSKYEDLAAYFVQTPIDLFGVYRTMLGEGPHRGHKHEPTKKCALLVALRGEAEFAYDGISYMLHPGKAFLGGYNRHMEIIVHSQEFEYFLVHYMPAAPGHAVPALMFEVNELHIEMDAALLQMIEQLRKLSTGLGNIELLEKKTLFYRLVNKALLFERYQQNSDSQPMMEGTIEYIRRHYMEPITLESLAGQQGLKAKYFSYLFRKYTGIGPIDYLIKYRMNVAHELLMNEPFSVRDIARSVGYADAYYFSRLFKKHYGLSPTEVKRQESRNNPS
ncbi:helix-turn-helix transcriptional regulator [Paenibacillus harenae]|uniref:AraC-like DNA-binding protein n=1 Tax=Paenibacillus harenae TaxID=306543 RepID=A0ABT9U728_PAEHA|nr:AraC family transcriptional regulator [Paenibacillus harenae]MDQ0114851.1 AraC-like DNA-binding protein [Paenibacillus harenae]